MTLYCSRGHKRHENKSQTVLLQSACRFSSARDQSSARCSLHLSSVIHWRRPTRWMLCSRSSFTADHLRLVAYRSTRCTICQLKTPSHVMRQFRHVAVGRQCELRFEKLLSRIAADHKRCKQILPKIVTREREKRQKVLSSSVWGRWFAVSSSFSSSYKLIFVKFSLS